MARKKLTTKIMQEFIKNPSGSAQSSGLTEIPVNEIYVAPQFREYFNPVEIDKLATSITDNGFQGTVVVRALRHSEDYGPEYNYLLIVGESRLRAVKQLGRATIPAQIKPEDFSDKEVRRLQADENLVRADLNDLEEAETILQMMADELGLALTEVVSLIDEAQNAERRDKTLTVDIDSQLSKLQSVLYRYKGEKTRSTPVSFLRHWRKLRNLDGPLLVALQEGVSASKLFELQGISDDDQIVALLAEVQSDDLTVANIRSRVRELKQQAEGKPKSDSKPELLDVPKSYKAVVKSLTAKKNWEWIREDPVRLTKAEELLEELKKLLHRSS